MSAEKDAEIVRLKEGICHAREVKEKIGGHWRDSELSAKAYLSHAQKLAAALALAEAALKLFIDSVDHDERGRAFVSTTGIAVALGKTEKALAEISALKEPAIYTKEELKTWFPAVCPKCNWRGLSRDTTGGEPIADTGDFGDPLCPECIKHDRLSPIEEDFIANVS